MTDHKQICFSAESENNKPLFFLGMLGIVNNKGFRVIENSLGFCKSNSVLMNIDLIFVLIPFKANLLHNYIIITP